jgi:hypothetical protein
LRYWLDATDNIIQGIKANSSVVHENGYAGECSAKRGAAAATRALSNYDGPSPIARPQPGCKLAIADLKNGLRHYSELAKRTATHAASLTRVLRLLASVGIFEEEEGGKFAQSPISESLRAHVPGSLARDGNACSPASGFKRHERNLGVACAPESRSIACAV